MIWKLVELKIAVGQLVGNFRVPANENVQTEFDFVNYPKQDRKAFTVT